MKLTAYLCIKGTAPTYLYDQFSCGTGRPVSITVMDYQAQQDDRRATKPPRHACIISADIQQHYYRRQAGMMHKEMNADLSSTGCREWQSVWPNGFGTWEVLIVGLCASVTGCVSEPVGAPWFLRRGRPNQAMEVAILQDTRNVRLYTIFIYIS